MNNKNIAIAFIILILSNKKNNHYPAAAMLRCYRCLLNAEFLGTPRIDLLDTAFNLRQFNLVRHQDA
jgi:hypothetical protein